MAGLAGVGARGLGSAAGTEQRGGKGPMQGFFPRVARPHRPRGQKNYTPGLFTKIGVGGRGEEKEQTW